MIFKCFNPEKNLDSQSSKRFKHGSLIVIQNYILSNIMRHFSPPNFFCYLPLVLLYVQCISAILTGQQVAGSRPNFRYVNRQFPGSSGPTFDSNTYDPDQNSDYDNAENEQDGYDQSYILYPEANAQSNYESTDISGSDTERSPIGGTGGRTDPVRPFDPARTPANSQLDLDNSGIITGYWTSRDSPASVSGPLYSTINRNPDSQRDSRGPGMSDVQQPNRRPLVPFQQSRPSQNTSRPQRPNNFNSGMPMDRPDNFQDSARPTYTQPNWPRPAGSFNPSNRPTYQNTGNQVPICRTEPDSNTNIQEQRPNYGNTQSQRPNYPAGRPGRRPMGDILADPGRGNVMIQGLGREPTPGKYQFTPYDMESQQPPSWPVENDYDNQEQPVKQTIAGIKAAAGWLLFRIIPDAINRMNA